MTAEMSNTEQYRHLFACSRALVPDDCSTLDDCKVLYGTQKLSPHDTLQGYACRTCRSPLSLASEATGEGWERLSIRRAKRIIASPITTSKRVECCVRVCVNGLRAPARLITTKHHARGDIARINCLDSGERGTTTMPAADAIREISGGGMIVCGILHSMKREDEPGASLLRSLEPILLYMSCRGDVAVAMDSDARTFLVPFADEVLIIARWNKNQ